MIADNFYLQNVHPYLAMYKHDLITEHMSYDDFLNLISDDNEIVLLQYLTDLGLLNTSQQCVNCGGMMRKLKQGNVWYWICTKRANGAKCNNNKFSVRKGTFFSKSKFNIQLQLRIIWNFIHRLSIVQCKIFFVMFGQKLIIQLGKYTLIVEIYALTGYGIPSILQN